MNSPAVRSTPRDGGLLWRFARESPPAAALAPEGGDAYPRPVAAEAFVLAFAAAWIHGASNVFLGRRPEPEAAIAMMLVIGVVAAAPVAALTWRVEAVAWPYIVASALLELGYFAFLAAAYRASEVSLVYPVARGAAPVLVLLGVVVVLGRGTTAGQVVGVVAVCAGILLVRGVRVEVAADSRGFLLALVTAAFIAGYTLVDKAGLEHAAPIPYIELVLIGPAVVYLLVIRRARGAAALKSETTFRLGVVAVILFATYVLILFALRIAPCRERLGRAGDECRRRLGPGSARCPRTGWPGTVRGRGARRHRCRARRPRGLMGRVANRQAVSRTN